MSAPLEVISTPLALIVGEEEKRGLLEALESRAGWKYRRAGEVLLSGLPYSMAAIAVGCTREAFTMYSKAHPDVGDLLARCEEIGFASTVESALYQRALAGKDDRASGQLLVTVAKARREEYRDKQQVTLAIHAAAQSARGAIEGDYHPAS